MEHLSLFQNSPVSWKRCAPCESCQFPRITPCRTCSCANAGPRDALPVMDEVLVEAKRRGIAV